MRDIGQRPAAPQGERVPEIPGRLLELVKPEGGLADPDMSRETGRVDSVRIEPQPVAHPGGRFLGHQEPLAQQPVARFGRPAHRVPYVGDMAATCGGTSFTADTKVLLASGAAIPISMLKPGDTVLATSVKTGKTQGEPVTAVMIHYDTNRYNLIVKAGGTTSIIHTTATHLFWDVHLTRIRV
ncbi:MAG TPA: hypothetical protein VFQ68_36675 [Streptosporangiaceae bacterium]|nr:hypothetical protein [Streptosporangiaceae bacterium]